MRAGEHAGDGLLSPRTREFGGFQQQHARPFSDEKAVPPDTKGPHCRCRFIETGGQHLETAVAAQQRRRERRVDAPRQDGIADPLSNEFDAADDRNETRGARRHWAEHGPMNAEFAGQSSRGIVRPQRGVDQSEFIIARDIIHAVAITHARSPA